MADPILEPARARKRTPLPPRLFTGDGKEVLVTLICFHCRKAKPLRLFGLRRMGDGTIRNCSWCKTCRAYGPKKETTP